MDNKRIIQAIKPIFENENSIRGWNKNIEFDYTSKQNKNIVEFVVKRAINIKIMGWSKYIQYCIFPHYK